MRAHQDAQGLEQRRRRGEGLERALRQVRKRFVHCMQMEIVVASANYEVPLRDVKRVFRMFPPEESYEGDALRGRTVIIVFIPAETKF